MLSTIKSFFSAIGAVFGYFKDKQLIDAGRDKEARKNNDQVIDNVKKSNDARRDSDKLDRVRDKYGNE